MSNLTTLATRSEKIVVGLMSGTSVDGVDAALVRIKYHGIDTEVTLLNFHTLDYPQGLQQAILENSKPGAGHVDDLCRLNSVVGEVFADAALSVIRGADSKVASVDLIGSHGQTVHHLPQGETWFGYPVRATLQIGEPSVIAKRTGIITVADFRPADMALGGQGAPLVPYFDYIIFHSPDKNRALVNIGGIANFSILKAGGALDEVMAYDTGPGNMVMDQLMQALFKRPFDTNGDTAATGKVSEPLLQWALSLDYFDLPPPKTTGREMFGNDFCEQLLTQANKHALAPEDIIATATELTARTIWNSYKRDVADKIRLDEMIVSGGGSQNAHLMQRLSDLAGAVRVQPIDDFGIPSKAKEAICFAVLANETICGQPANVPSATGARSRTILGKICL